MGFLSHCGFKNSLQFLVAGHSTRFNTQMGGFFFFHSKAFLFLSWVPFIQLFYSCGFSLICENGKVGWLAPGIVYKSVHLKKGFLVCLELVTTSPIPTYINPIRKLKKLNARVCLEIAGKKNKNVILQFNRLLNEQHNLSILTFHKFCIKSQQFGQGELDKEVRQNMCFKIIQAFPFGD